MNLPNTGNSDRFINLPWKGLQLLRSHHSARLFNPSICQLTS